MIYSRHYPLRYHTPLVQLIYPTRSRTPLKAPNIQAATFALDGNHRFTVGALLVITLTKRKLASLGE